MTTILTTKNIQEIIQIIGFENFILGLIRYLETDYVNWHEFEKTPRIAFYKNKGVMELMPICGPDLFAFKYVNGHPDNVKLNKPTVIGLGMLTSTSTGEPLMISEMTLLTALRTAATSSMASKFLANKIISNFGIIGCGSQSEFQTLAHFANFKFKQVFYYDLDKSAMHKFKRNLNNQGFDLIPCSTAQEVVLKSQIVTTATACTESQEVIKADWLQPGQHLNCIGGDSPNKTELDLNILYKVKTVVEYLPQTLHEGEIQNLGHGAEEYVSAELWEVIKKTKKVRTSIQDITLFDSVGFALEDYSVLRYLYDLANKLKIFNSMEITPQLKDCKDLYSSLTPITHAYLGFSDNSHYKNAKIFE